VPSATPREIGKWVALLIAGALPIVLLSKSLDKVVDTGIDACLSTLGLTLPAVLTIGLITGENVVLGLDPTGIVLIVLTLLLSIVTFSGPKTTVLEGAVHLLVFFVYVVLVFSP
jgi:Ca2+:H+ antiporter